MAMYDNIMPRAFPGMKADSGDDRVESFAAGAVVPFGRVVGSGADPLIVAPGPGTKVRGVSVHSHTIPGTGYVQFDCVSVMTRGHIWAETAGTVATIDGPVRFGADGRVSDAGANVLPNAIFRSAATTSDTYVLVELHAPFSETDTVA